MALSMQIICHARLQPINSDGVFKSYNRDTRRKSWMKSRKFEEQLESDKIQPEILKEVIKEVEEDEHQTSQ